MAALRPAILASNSLLNSSRVSPSNSWAAVARCLVANCSRIPSRSVSGLSTMLTR